MSEAFIYEAVRTPFGRFGGALAGVRPDDLAARRAARAARARRRPRPGGDRRRDPRRSPTAPARTTATSRGWPCCSPGLPTRVTGATVNRLCGSSLEAAIQATPRDPLRRRLARRRRRRRVDEPRAVGAAQALARRTRPATRRCTRRRSAGAWSTRRCPRSGRSRSARAPRSSPAIYGITREAQDAFALRSHQLAAQAYDEGVLREVVPVPGVALERDEGIRTDTSLEKLAALARRVRRGRHRDGRQLLAAQRRREHAPARRRARRRAARPRAARARRRERRARRRPRRLRHRPGRGGQPGARARRASAGARSSPSSSTRRSRRSRSPASRGWPELDPELVNVRGGAIAIGHPLGASGARILGRLAHELHARGGGYGVATLCIGVGQGLAVILEA